MIHITILLIDLQFKRRMLILTDQNNFIEMVCTSIYAFDKLLIITNYNIKKDKNWRRKLFFLLLVIYYYYLIYINKYLFFFFFLQKHLAAIHYNTLKQL